MRNPGADQPTSTSVHAAQILLERGWGKPHQTVTVNDTPENRGMIYTASHLLKVEKA